MGRVRHHGGSREAEDFARQHRPLRAGRFETEMQVHAGVIARSMRVDVQMPLELSGQITRALRSALQGKIAQYKKEFDEL